MLSAVGKSSFARLKYLETLSAWDLPGRNWEGLWSYLAAGLPPFLVDLFTCDIRYGSIFLLHTTSIIARCSRLSCVWNNASPV